jgi:hypothetical protein
LILKCGTALRRLWRWRHDNYDVVEDGIVGGYSCRRTHRSTDVNVDVERTQGAPASLWL